MDKLLPIDSIYTIGSFTELIEQFLMPSLIIQEDQELQLIALEVWPFRIDILMDSDLGGPERMTSHWYYHMYDNNIRIFLGVNGAVDEMRYLDSENILIDIIVHPISFKKFFEPVAQDTPNQIGRLLEDMKEIDDRIRDDRQSENSFENEIIDDKEKVTDALKENIAEVKNQKFCSLNQN